MTIPRAIEILDFDSGIGDDWTDEENAEGCALAVEVLEVLQHFYITDTQELRDILNQSTDNIFS
jgi:hypothetical protein